LLALLAAGIVLAHYHDHAPQVMIFGRPTSVPHTMELFFGLPFILVSVWKVRSHLQKLRHRMPGLLRAD
jgi:hypothetical protein